jgi:disease resistance protein RPM1
MELASEALSALLSKLSMLLYGKYNLEKGVRGDIQRVMNKLERVHAALGHESEAPVPLEQIFRPRLVKMWARDVMELSYDMEDLVDTFLVRVQGPERTSKRSAKRFMNKIYMVVNRHEIAQTIKYFEKRVQQIDEPRRRRSLKHLISTLACVHMNFHLYCLSSILFPFLVLTVTGTMLMLLFLVSKPWLILAYLL